MRTIKKIFDKLCKRYKLDGVELAVANPKFFSDSYTQAEYITAHDIPGVIVLRRQKVAASNISAMLHELAHAIQHREGRFIIPDNHTRQNYALELEAETFARIEYRKLFERKYGKVGRWNLADYDSYRKMWTTGRVPNECYTMNDHELYQFVRQLKGSVKRPILKRLDRKNPKYNWEKALCKIAV